MSDRCLTPFFQPMNLLKVVFVLFCLTLDASPAEGAAGRFRNVSHVAPKTVYVDVTHSAKVVVAPVKEKPGPTCLPVHANHHGVNLVCCSKATPVTADCQYRTLCNSPVCKCHVFVGEDLTCDVRAPSVPTVTWLDHSSAPVSSFVCLQPHFPNHGVEFAVTLSAFDARLSPLLLAGLASYNVTSLTVLAKLNDSFWHLNFSAKFPYLRTLVIKSPVVVERSELPDNALRPAWNLHELLGLNTHLEHLTLINVDFNWGQEPRWLPSLTRLHVENSSLQTLPRWLAQAKQLQRLTITRTRLASVVVVSQLKSLISVNLDNNQVSDVHRVLFGCRNVIELSLRNNNITSIGAHTFIECVNLRVLDLSKNAIAALPPKAFQANGKLKVLRLDENRISALGLQHFIGLDTLRTLSLAGNALETVEPFAFLPLAKSLRALVLDGCNLTSLPLAVTQCCLLDSLDVNDNLLHDAGSMPVEVLALISGIRHLGFERNPLMSLPRGLFLLSTANEDSLGHVLDTLVQLPVWRHEPCTPFMWHEHVANGSAMLRRRVAVWSAKRMEREGLGHCRLLYESLVDGLAPYRDLVENSGCEANRRLRRVTQSCRPPRNKSRQRPIKVPEPPKSPSGVRVAEKPLRQKSVDYGMPFLLSLATNACLTVVLTAVVLAVACQKKRRAGFEAIQGSDENVPSNSS